MRRSDQQLYSYPLHIYMDLDSEPQECFLDQLDKPYPEISISVTEGVPRGHGLGSYISYVIKMRCPSQMTVQRRYSEFAALREVLVRRWPGVIIPCLPAKHASGSNSLRIVNERIKYLSYFLNNCVKLNFIFMSDEFQLFLTSTDPDLKTRLEKLPTLPYYLMLHRYQEAFPGMKGDETRKAEIAIAMRDQVEPFRKLINGQRIALINLKKEVYRLALRREEYLRTTKILYSNTLPALQAHLARTAQHLIPILDTPQVKEGVGQLKQCNARDYWVVFECLKLQIGEAQAAIDALQSREDLERQQDRLAHQIAVNEEELTSINNKKMTLKQFFNRNHEQLALELMKKNEELRKEVESLRILNLVVAEITIGQLAQGYKQRRQELWRTTWKNYVGKEQQLSVFLKGFYSIFQKQ